MSPVLWNLSTWLDEKNNVLEPEFRSKENSSAFGTLFPVHKVLLSSPASAYSVQCVDANICCIPGLLVIWLLKGSLEMNPIYYIISVSCIPLSFFVVQGTLTC